MKKIEMHLEIGNDNGNSEHSMVINGKLIRQSNIMAKIRKLPLLDEINPSYVCKYIHSNLTVSVNSPSAETGTYHIGDYALRSGSRVRDIKVGFDNKKLDSDVVIINTLSQIAGYGLAQAFEDGEDIASIELYITVDMTTGLPVTQYSKRSAQELMAKFMTGRHNITLHVGEVNVNAYISFESVRVLPESVPAIFALQSLSGEDGSVSDGLLDGGVFEGFGDSINKTVSGDYFKDKRILHVGIGEGTTEYPLTEDIAFNPSFINGSNNGIGHAIDRALSEFKKEKGLMSYSRQEYSEIIRNESHKYHDTAMDIIEGYIEEESDDILRLVASEIQKLNNEVDIVMIYGGGSILMREHLEDSIRAICDRAEIELFYVPEEYAVTLECIGMYAFTKGVIFKKLKERQTLTTVSDN